MPGTNFSKDVEASCDDRDAMINIAWSSSFYTLTLDFGSVSCPTFSVVIDYSTCLEWNDEPLESYKANV